MNLLSRKTSSSIVSIKDSILDLVRVHSRCVPVAVDYLCSHLAELRMKHLSTSMFCVTDTQDCGLRCPVDDLIVMFDSRVREQILI